MKRVAAHDLKQSTGSAAVRAVDLADLRTWRILTGRVGALLLAGCTTGATFTPGPW
jgi:hypothetical protein